MVAGEEAMARPVELYANNNLTMTIWLGFQVLDLKVAVRHLDTSPA
jgi:hypothetical protein